MKLSRIYSNQPDQFRPIAFLPGLNAVLAEIRLPENRMKDTHNLGKSILARLIDFMFLDDRDRKFFLFKHFSLFQSFVFFLEVDLLDNGYLTLRRSVAAHSKISFKRHARSGQDFSALEDQSWDHLNVPLQRARDLLDGLLDWRGLQPWTFRKFIGYSLRSQDDFRDVFHLTKFAGPHADWKPFLAHFLGFDAAAVADLYENEIQVKETKATVDTVKRELGGSVEDLSKIEGLLLLKQREADRKQKLLDTFDFRRQDMDKTQVLVDEIDERIGALNSIRYSLARSRKKIISSLEESEILFDPEEAERLFKQAGVLFQGQIKRDFEELIGFNRAITAERRTYLMEERAEIEAELRRVTSELSALGKRRSDALSFLSEQDSFQKYKSVSTELVTLRADISSLERQRGHLHRLQELRTEIRDLEKERTIVQGKVEADVEHQNTDSQSLFSSIRLFFSEIVEEVIDRKALLSVSPNSLGHLEFRAEILDESGNATSADLGRTYRKLLSIAFDLAVLRAHLGEKFPRFVYHDGAFESLDDRKKRNLMAVLHGYCDLGLQVTVTLIDSDLPHPVDDSTAFIPENEVILRLHDEGEAGRLFKIRSW